MNLEKTQQLLERLAGLLRAEARQLLAEHGLQPVQFEALHYLSVCNRYSDTLMGVAEYLNQTKGTVSQTLKALESKGLIKKVPDQTDRRVAHLSLTASGWTLIHAMPASPLLTSAGKQLTGKDIASLEASLQHLLKQVQRANDFKTFGQCATCRHNIKLSAKEYRCGLTQESLSSKDVELICKEHEPDPSY